MKWNKKNKLPGHHVAHLTEIMYHTTIGDTWFVQACYRGGKCKLQQYYRDSAFENYSALKCLKFPFKIGWFFFTQMSWIFYTVKEYFAWQI